MVPVVIVLLPLSDLQEAADSQWAEAVAGIVAQFLIGRSKKGIGEYEKTMQNRATAGSVFAFQALGSGYDIRFLQP